MADACIQLDFFSNKKPRQVNWRGFAIWGIQYRGLQRGQHSEADADLYADNQHTHGGG